MPFKAPDCPKCPKCGKSVYAAEARAVGELQFHKECFKCSMCNKMLDSTNLNCHEATLFCKTCHGRKYGPKGYGFGGGAGTLNMDSGERFQDKMSAEVKAYRPPKAAPGEGCPRCNGKVFAAELMMAKGKSYHKTCFNCKTCKKPLDSMVHCDGPDNEVYCKACYGKKFGPKGYGYGGSGGILKCEPDAAPLVKPHGNPDLIVQAEEGEQGCPRCGGKVYMAELMMAKGRPFHKKCFKCRNCKRPLDSMVHCDAPDGEIYCKLCYAKKYGPKGYGFAAGAGGILVAENIPGGESGNDKSSSLAALDVTLIQAEPGKGCPRCGGKVFAAEEMIARGRSWHKRCYNCCHCHRPLDSVVGCDAPDGEIYCKLCYAKRHGPKGYGFAAGAGGVLVAENISGGDEGNSSKIKPIDVSSIQAEPGQGCPRCGGKVFMAEEIHVGKKSWHKRCYNCCLCHRPLDSVVGCDAPDGEVYCKLCYAKHHGPKGYGFAAGCGGVLVAENTTKSGASLEPHKGDSGAINTTSIPAAPGEGCPRCGGKVFNAEERLSKSKKFHKRCFNCVDCRRPLDSMVLCDAPDGEIYCKLCYAKKFGPKGYGFAAGMGGILYPEDISFDDIYGEPVAQTAPPAHTDMNYATIPAKEGQSRCPRCGGAVFMAEAIPVRGKEWHKRCYNCCECHRPLDSMVGCDAPDGEIYCKLCYAKRHGPKGYGFGHVPTLVATGSEDGGPMPTDIRQFGFGAKGPREWVPPIAPVSGQRGPSRPGSSASNNTPRALPVGTSAAPFEQNMPPWAREQASSTNHTKQFSESSTSSTVQQRVTSVKTEHVQQSSSVQIVQGVRVESGSSVQVIGGVVASADDVMQDQEEEEEYYEDDVETAELCVQADENMQLEEYQPQDPVADIPLGGIPPEIIAQMAALQASQGQEIDSAEMQQMQMEQMQLLERMKQLEQMQKLQQLDQMRQQQMYQMQQGQQMQQIQQQKMQQIQQQQMNQMQMQQTLQTQQVQQTHVSMQMQQSSAAASMSTQIVSGSEMIPEPSEGIGEDL